MIAYDFVLGIGFGYQRGNSHQLIGEIPVGGIIPIVITVLSRVWTLKFWAADDPMTGGFREDGLLWYSVDEIQIPLRRIVEPELRRVPVYNQWPASLLGLA